MKKSDMIKLFEAMKADYMRLNKTAADEEAWKRNMARVAVMQDVLNIMTDKEYANDKWALEFNENYNG